MPRQRQENVSATHQSEMAYLGRLAVERHSGALLILAKHDQATAPREPDSGWREVRDWYAKHPEGAA